MYKQGGGAGFSMIRTFDSQHTTRRSSLAHDLIGMCPAYNFEGKGCSCQIIHMISPLLGPVGQTGERKLRENNRH
jgi:hypothetical protein